MDFKLLTFVFASFVVYVIRGQEYKCRFVPYTNCIVNNSLEGSAAGELMEDDISQNLATSEYACIPTNNMCNDSEGECKSFLLKFTSPLDAVSNTTLHIAYQTEEGNYNIEQQIGLQKEYSFKFNKSNGYTMEFHCKHDQESFKYVLIDNLTVKCQTECDISGSKSRTAVIIVVMILLMALAVFVVGLLLILRHKRIAKEKAKFDRENPDYQSLKRNRTSRQYQFPSLWQKRNKRNPSSASEQVYEVCGKIECQKQQKDESDVLDYDYAYAQSVAGHLRKGFEDSGGYLKPDLLDEEAYLKPSPSSSKRSTVVDSNNIDENGYLKPSSSKTNISSSPRNSKIETDITSDDDSDYEYVVPHGVIRDTSPSRPNSGTPKEKPVVPRKPKLHVTTSSPSVSEKSSPVTRRPQPSPRTNKRASASADKDYLSIIEPERTSMQQSVKNTDLTT